MAHEDHIFKFVKCTDCKIDMQNDGTIDVYDVTGEHKIKAVDKWSCPSCKKKVEVYFCTNEGRLLTQAEVDALPEGTVVGVIWNGVNTPHRYVIEKRDGKVYVGQDRFCIDSPARFNMVVRVKKS